MLGVGRVSESATGKKFKKSMALFCLCLENLLWRKFGRPQRVAQEMLKESRVSSCNAKSKDITCVGMMTTVSGVEMSRDLACAKESIRDVPQRSGRSGCESGIKALRSVWFSSAACWVNVRLHRTGI